MGVEVTSDEMVTSEKHWLKVNGNSLRKTLEKLWLSEDLKQVQINPSKPQELIKAFQCCLHGIKAVLGGISVAKIPF